MLNQSALLSDMQISLIGEDTISYMAPQQLAQLALSSADHHRSGLPSPLTESDITRRSWFSTRQVYITESQRTMHTEPSEGHGEE